MIKSQSERYLESLLPNRRELVNVHICGDFENPDKPLELKDTVFAAMNSDAMARVEWAMQEHTEEQILSAMKSVLDPVFEERRKQQKLVDCAILRTACKKYAAITGKHAVDLTNGIPEDFRAVYDSVVNALSVDLFAQPSKDIWKMAARLMADDWGKI